MISLFSRSKRHLSTTIEKAIMGLGNPGKQYRNNRHNFGFLVLDRLAEDRELDFRSGGRPYLWCHDKRAGVATGLIKPLTYMNNSGAAARELLKQNSLLPENMLVIYDDIDLPLGRLRLRPDGSPGGHKGIKSIASQLETDRFPRLRLGIGPQPQGVPAEEFVLDDFTNDEMKTVREIIELCGEILIDYLKHDISTVMSRYNSIDLRDTNTGVA